jgi:septal ring factor EnvC (AmiA/AmiB activator)
MDDRPRWIAIVEQELSQRDRRLDELRQVANRAEAERDSILRQLADAIDAAEKSRRDLRVALAQVRRLLLQHHDGDPYWRKDQEQTPLGQADVVAERALGS